MFENKNRKDFSVCVAQPESTCTT